MNPIPSTSWDVSDLCLIELENSSTGEVLFSSIERCCDQKDLQCNVTPYQIPRPFAMQKNNPKPSATPVLTKSAKLTIVHIYICEKYKDCIIGEKPHITDIVKLQNSADVIIPTFSIFDNILMITDLIYIEANKHIADQQNLDANTLNKNVKEFIDFIAANYRSHEADKFRETCPCESAIPSISGFNSNVYFTSLEKPQVFEYCTKRMIENLNKIGSYDPVKDFYPIFAYGGPTESEVKKCITTVVKQLHDVESFGAFFKCVMMFYLTEPEEAATVMEIFYDAVVGTDLKDIFGPMAN